MERLIFDKKSQYDGLEAAIHVARYLLASTHCKGRRVLDIACGEGYGSRLLKDWGASEVLGVDVSAEAIQHAQNNFGGEGVSFRCAAAEDLPHLLAGQGFDLIVSLETIEHLQDPERFLADLRQALNPGGCIIISCPNDWWYFPTEQEKNPYHIRKYHFDEFRKQTESVLGVATAWLYGAPTFGFLNTIRGAVPGVTQEANQLEMVNGENINLAHVLPAELNAGPADSNASYFVGVWGGELDALSGTVALLPLSMDAFKKGIFQGHFSADQELVVSNFKQTIASIDEDRENLRLEASNLTEQVGKLRLLQQSCADENNHALETINHLKTYNSRLIEENVLRENEVRKMGLLRQAVLAENDAMRHVIHQLKSQASQFSLSQVDTNKDISVDLNALQQKINALQVGHDRYVRISALLPGGFRRFVMKIKKIYQEGK